MPITNLVYTDTFKTWFDTTNSIINSVNGITVYNILAGDGIGITSANNIFTISHGSNVATGVTFTGNVNFNGSVSFASSPSISSTTINISPKVAGITSGNVVRITSSGLTLAKADSRVNAEVLGVVVNENASSHFVAINGAVNNSVFANTISNALGIAGGTLIAGRAYFLDPVVAGGITANEPETYGQVTKPILLGITGDVGSLIPYRGIELEGISAGITAELDNKIIITVDYTAPSSILGVVSGYYQTVKKGDPVFYAGPLADSGWVATLSLAFGDYKLLGNLYGETTKDDIPSVVIYGAGQSAGSLMVNAPDLLGVVSNILSDTGSQLILEVNLYGGAFNVKKSELDTNQYSFIGENQSTTYSGGNFGWASDLAGNFALRPLITPQSTATSCVIKLIPFNDPEETLRYILLQPDRTAIVPTRAGVRTTSGVTGSLEYDNLIPNGAFTIWQRQTTALTAGSVDSYSTPFADRWFITNKYNTTGLTLDVSRQVFDSDQISVPGSPLYYVDAKAQYLTAALPENRIRLENIQTNARLLQNEQTTISFWAKSTVSGATVDIFYNRYQDSYSNSAEVEQVLESRTVVTPIGITLTSGWSEYKYTFVPSAAGFTLGATASGWFGVGFEFPNSTATISLAQVQLELGSSVSDPVYVDPQEELQRCKPYYLRTYDWDQANGFVGVSTLNEHNLQLGNLITQKNYIVKFPVKMVKDPTVVLYSPNTGQSGDAYNVNTGVDMRYSSSDYKTNLPWDLFSSRTAAAWPTPNITVPSVSRNGMTVYVSNGATHLDTLQFHYVADADIDLNV